MLTVADLVFDFWIGVTLAVTLVLMLLSPAHWRKGLYLLILLSLAFWLRSLIFDMGDTRPFWFYVLPPVWIVTVLALSFPKTGNGERVLPPGEPRVTLESLQGSAGTSEALLLYFTLIWLLSVSGLWIWSLLGAFRLIAFV